MFKNYFKTAWRHFIKDKQFSFLNLLGLSTGLACVILIYLWVDDELRVDTFNKDDNHLYQVLKRNHDGTGAIQVNETTQGLLAESMAKEFPEVDFATCLKKQSKPAILSFNEKEIKAKLAFAGKDFFHVFSFAILDGDKENLLPNHSSILISDATALKLFNRTDVSGQTINLSFTDGVDDFSNVYTIESVFKAPPASATDQFDVLFPFSLYAQKKAGGMGDITFWGSNMVSSYLLLKPGTNLSAFNNKIKDYTKEKVADLYAGKDLVKYEGELFLQKYSDRYLYNNFDDGVQSGGRIEYVKLFSVIAIFILVIACINFMNLSTAKASRRMKEVGVKKVVGASKRALMVQFVGESMLMVYAAAGLAVLMVYFLLPAFRQVTGKETGLHLDLRMIIAVVIIALLTGLLAGSYPAFYLSRSRPVLVLKGKLKTKAGELFIRKGLVVFQFVVSVSLIVSVLVIYRQMRLIQNTDLGYDKEQVIRFESDGQLQQKLPLFIAELKNIPGVVNASDVNGDLLGNSSHSGGGIGWEGKDPNLHIEYYGNSADIGYFETMGLQISEGRTFTPGYGDSSSVIFNEAAIAAMGIKDPVGKIVSLWGKNKRVIGVVKDYHYESLYHRIGPAFFTYSTNNPTIVAKIKAGTDQQTIAAIKALYSKYNSGLDFTYSFLDDDYNRLYASEQRVSILSRFFAGIAILISCLGLFGLAAFTAQKRQKEIGIRKVIGASTGQVVALLSKEFLRIVVVALVIAIPLSWWAAHQWLEGFAYRIHLSFLPFAMAGISVLLITFLTIGFQSIKAALADPVKSLRAE